LALSVSSLAYSANDIKLPDMGDSTGTLISPLQEKALGESFFRNIQSQLPISNDPDIQQYIQSIGQHIASHSDNPQQAFYFFVVLSQDINAFAGPGGFIGINSGLILNSESESELASVIAHEIAHVTQRHIYRAYEAANRMTLPAAAAMIAAIIVATQAPEMGIGAVSAIQAGSAQMQINFTRDNEQEADRVGLQSLARANFDPRSMPAFFEKLQQASRYYGTGAPEFLRTHPITSSRIADTRGRAETYPYRQSADSQMYRLIKAKLRTLGPSSADDLIVFFEKRLSIGTQKQREAMQYGLALSYAKKQNTEQASTLLKKLHQSDPQQTLYLSSLARISSLNGDFTVADSYYQSLQTDYPENQSFKREGIANLIKAKKAQRALQQLKAIPYAFQHHSQYYLLLAQSYGLLKKTAYLHRYMAEYYYVTGQTSTAIMQIKLAQQAKGNNFYLAAILEDRLQFFKAEITALKHLENL